jgi:hypothetical protein
VKLADIQTGFQAALLADEEPCGGVLEWLKNSSRTDCRTLFGVYYDAYRLRLAEIVSNDFPILRLHLGDQAFGRLVENYISSAPSRQHNARWYASRLPDFMSETTPWSANRSACDLARLERALTDAFDAADATVLGVADLQTIDIEDWPCTAFDFHPSVAILDVMGGTAALYEALAENNKFSASQRAAETIITWRSENETSYRLLDEDERLAVMEAKQGKKFGDICALLSFQKDDENVAQRAAGFLSQWFVDGLVAGLQLAK